VPDGVAQDLADLFLGAATVPARPALELGLYVVLELADQDLRHVRMIS
jgi:hypothetical protein